MRLRSLTASLLALLTAVALASGGAVPARATASLPTYRAAPALPATSITRKVTLPETSIDAPALSSVFIAHLGSRSAIAWTGTDPEHHLNVETSFDGLTFQDKRTLPETSPFRPDVALSAPGSPVTVAWTGTDPNHSLNVLYDVYGSSPKKLTLRDEHSFTSPALLVRPSAPGQGASSMFLAWAGTDPQHLLNILPITVTASELVPGQKITLTQLNSNAGPHLAWHEPNGPTPTLVLNWTTPTRQLKIATSTDGVHFSPELGIGLPETSDFAPDTVNITFFPATPGPADWIGWTGTDPAHHLNLQSTTTFPNFTDPASTKTTLTDTALGGPALAFNFNGQIAWTGTDPAHHVNIGAFALQ